MKDELIKQPTAKLAKYYANHKDPKSGYFNKSFFFKGRPKHAVWIDDCYILRNIEII